MNNPYKEYHDLEQGSQAWIDARCGLLTASDLKKLVTPTLKIANNDTSRKHVAEIAAQQIGGFVEAGFFNEHMARGVADEPMARDIYEEAFCKDTTLKQCGFITRDFGDGVVIGYSPDGLVGDDGLIEVKSRTQSLYLASVVNPESAEKDTMLQIQTGLLVTGRDWCDLLVYCGGFKLFPYRIYPDQDYHDAILAAAKEFYMQVDELVEAYVKKSGDPETRSADTKRVYFA